MGSCLDGQSFGKENAYSADAADVNDPDKTSW